VGLANIRVLLIAKTLNASNAKYIIASYNTMSDFDRKKLVLKDWWAYGRRWRILLGCKLF